MEGPPGGSATVSLLCPHVPACDLLTHVLLGPNYGTFLQLLLAQED